jgi:hypothetical protein
MLRNYVPDQHQVRREFPIVALMFLTLSISVYSSGLVLLAHILAAVIAPVLLSFASKNKTLRTLWLCAVLWGSAQIVSDTVHDLTPGSMPTIFGTSVALLATGLVWVRERYEVRPTSILIAAGLAWFVLELSAGAGAARSNPWKYGLAFPTVMFLLAVVYHRGGKRSHVALVFLAAAGVSLFFDARFNAGLFGICGVAILLIRPRTHTGVARVRGAAILVMLLTAAAYFAYPAVAVTGLLGTRAYAQQIQYDAEGANFLLSTRMELPQMAILVTMHPLLGVGSFGEISAQDASVALNFINDNIAPLGSADVSYLTSASTGSTGYRAHSEALSTVLYAGVAALPFWILVVVTNFRLVSRFARGQADTAGILVFLVGLSTWDLLFSPLSNRSGFELVLLYFLAAAPSSQRS